MRTDVFDSSVQRASFNGEQRNSFVFRFSQYDPIIPQWWTPDRDRFLRAFWKSEGTLSSAIYSVASRNAAFGWELTGSKSEVEVAQKLLQAADFGGGWQQFITKISEDYLTCLAGPSTVMLGGKRRGKRKSIFRMVKDRDEGPVIAVDADGKLVEKRVINWYKNELGNRKWMWLRSKYSSFHSGKRKGGLFLTNDHLINTVRGWIRADELVVGDKIKTGYPEPNREQMQVIIGTMLGDACMSSKHGKSSTILRLAHSEKQDGWLDMKVKALSGFGWTPKFYRESTFDEHKSKGVGLNSHCTPGLFDVFDEWYRGKRKVVPINMVREYFSARMLATWFLDDGSRATATSKKGKKCRPGINLYTNGFTFDETEELAQILTDNGFDAYVVTFKQSGKRYPVIHIGANASELFYRTIAQFVPPFMRYKLPEDIYELDKYAEDAWNCGTANSFIDEVEIIKYRNYESGYSVSKTAYCIDVEDTHNFSVAGINVHNCDNGAFMEVIRPAKIRIDNKPYPVLTDMFSKGDTKGFYMDGSDAIEFSTKEYDVYDSPLDLPIGIAHMDSARVTRTGDRDIPFIYTDKDGYQHKLRWWQVVDFVDMPSTDSDMNNVGFCAVSRAFRFAHIAQSMSIFKDEKLSGRFNRAIHITNADPDVLNDQIRDAQRDMDDRGLVRYSQPVVATTFDPTTTPQVATIDLASIPDGFTEEGTMNWYIAILALALGVDYSFLAPLPGKGLGTASQSETMARQARGKSSRLFMDMITTALNFRGILPSSVQFEFIERDTQQEVEEENVKQQRAKTRQVMIANGEINPQISRQLANDSGDLSSKYLEAMGEEDIVPGITAQGNISVEAVDEAQSRKSKGARKRILHIDDNALQQRKQQLLYKKPLAKSDEDDESKALGEKAFGFEDIGNEQLRQALGVYHDDFTDLVEKAPSMSPSEFEETLNALIALTIVAIFAIFSEMNRGDFEESDYIYLEEMVTYNLESVPGLSERIYRIDSLLPESIIGLWVASVAAVANYAMLRNPTKQNMKLTWVLGATEHCQTCAALEGQVHTRAEWLDSGLAPQCVDCGLLCGGWRCGCWFEEVPSNYPNRGNLDSVPRK